MPHPRSALLLLVLSACDLGQYGSSAGRYHPDGYAAAEVHGLDLKQQAQDCRSCHGEELAGATGTSCDSCHTPAEPTAWRSDCTFCHGGGTDDTGAPPRNLDGTSEVQAGTFPPHAVHVGGGIAAAYDCVQCHVKATDALSQGHIFDTTAGVAEVDMGGGLSGLGEWDRAAGCSNTYCHGNGRGDTGAIAADAGAMTCTSCHAGMDESSQWVGMSGLHALHLGASGVTCAECHQEVTTDGTTIAVPELHVDGVRQVAFLAADFAMDGAAKTCTGTCHGHGHTDSGWGDGGGGGDIHPDGFAASTLHGPEFELARQDCRGSCHGDQLQGASGPSCDSCHDAGWRTDCTYCHGGGANQTGAPPRDLASTNLSQSLSFRAHTRHVTAGMASAFDCVQCHVKPDDVLSPGHVLDATPGAAEVRFTGQLNAGGAYNGAGTCSTSYCHGNGRGANGTIADGAPPRTCASCHGSQTVPGSWDGMSGDHKKHLEESGVTCATCHVTVTTNGTTIASRALHVDGGKSVAFNFSGMTYTVATKACTGPCHGENHNGDRW
jgi:predicted CxxxxCH...CXXCH cytochrome family protein